MCLVYIDSVFYYGTNCFLGRATKNDQTTRKRQGASIEFLHIFAR
jgi:hypothetical protein